MAVNVTAVTPGHGRFHHRLAVGHRAAADLEPEFPAGADHPEHGVVPIGADGKIKLYNESTGTVQLLADVAGYIVGGTPTVPGAFASLAPTRILDTRSNLGAAGPVAAHGTVSLKVLGNGGVPATGVSAVALNVTVVDPAKAGFITVWPSGTARQLTSNLNFQAGQNIPNMVIVPVGADGKIQLFNGPPAPCSWWPTSPVTSSAAPPPCQALSRRWRRPGSWTPAPTSVRPARSRPGHGFPAGHRARVAFRSPASPQSSVNVTVADPAAAGFITVWPSGTARQQTSNLNFQAGQNIPNLVIVPVGADGKIQLFNGSAGTRAARSPTSPATPWGADMDNNSHSESSNDMVAKRTTQMLSVSSTPARVTTRSRRKMVVALGATAAMVAGMVLAFVAPANAAPPAAKTVVSLTFDDGHASQQFAFDTMKQYGMLGTFYMNSGFIGANGFLTLDQVKAIAAYGNEIGSHTVSHPDLATVSADEASRQICNDRVNWAAWGIPTTNFAYPFASSTTAIETLVKNCGNNSARGLGDIKTRFSPTVTQLASAMPVPAAELYYTKAPDQVETTWTLDDLKLSVTQAEAAGGWVQLTFHDICDVGTCPDPNISPAIFQQFVSWLAPRASRGTVVERVQDVIGGARPLRSPVRSHRRLRPG